MSYTDSGLILPDARLKHLASHGNTVVVDPNIPAVR